METPRLRDREAVALDLIGVAGITAFVIGLILLRTSEQLGFDPAKALDGVLGQLSVTVPAALLVLGASALELAAGVILARAARRGPFDSLAEAAIAAMVAAVLKDTLLLGTLAAFGLFRAPLLIGIDVLVVAAALLPPLAGRLRPITAFAGWRDQLGSLGPWPLTVLVAIVWAGPVILQLASPVVPFIDVLPNYVGPVEHLRTFGWFSPLTATQSPIFGPSRTVLGYDGLLGAVATMTGLPGGLTIAGFILPQTLLVGAGAARLAGAIRNGDPPVGAWALLAFALSQPFARLADARGTVVVVPLVCAGLAVAAELIRHADARPPEGWRIGRGAAIGLALGAATLVHPVIGFLAIVTVAIVGLLRPQEAAPDVLVAGLTAGLVALPQLATMVGLSLPTLALGIGLPIATAAGIGAGVLVGRSERARAGIARLADVGRLVVLVAIVVAIAGAFLVAILNLDKAPDAASAALGLTLESSGLLLIALAVGAALGSRGARSPIVLVALVTGIVAAGLTQVLPDDLGILGSALRYEVPKTVHYWLSAMAAAGAATALAFAWSRASLPLLARAGLLAAFVVTAALPIRFGSSGDDAGCKTSCAAINAYHLGEHRWSETFAIDLRYAGSGFWQGFPDSRFVVDAPRRELLDAVRAEITAGRLEHDTPVLHVARSFQQWVATPLGVFDGVIETFVSLDPEVSSHTVGGRLYGDRDPAELMRQLDEFVRSGDFPYVVLEPSGLPDGVRGEVEAAGYEPIFANDQGEVFRQTG